MVRLGKQDRDGLPAKLILTLILILILEFNSEKE
jgi:hypothetical protein